MKFFLFVILEPWWRQNGSELLRYFNLLSALLQFAAMLVFAYAMHKRVVSVKKILQARQIKDV